MMTKSEMFADGQARIELFCRANDLQVPEVRPVHKSDWPFAVCAYYRPTYINICLDKCANIGQHGMQWSYPGYIADRTPYGVLAHEIGHHCDRERSVGKGPYFGEFSIQTRKASGEKRLTSYCPNDAEWFAEMMRLFITNSDLLRLLRPKTYSILSKHFAPVECRYWDDVLRDAPLRTREMACKHVDRAVS